MENNKKWRSMIRNYWGLRETGGTVRVEGEHGGIERGGGMVINGARLQMERNSKKSIGMIINWWTQRDRGAVRNWGHSLRWIKIVRNGEACLEIGGH